METFGITSVIKPKIVDCVSLIEYSTVAQLAQKGHYSIAFAHFSEHKYSGILKLLLKLGRGWMKKEITNNTK